jgi:beta-lactamase regulating signal transducer with metallopeptidase domain
MSGTVISGLLGTSAFLALVIAAFLPLRRLLRAAIGSQWVCALWLVLLVRLLAPVPLATRWGVMNLWERDSAAPATSAGPMEFKVSFPADNPVAKGQPVSAGPTGATMPMEGRSSSLDLPYSIWLAGFLVGLALLAWSGVQTALLAKQSRPASDERLIAIFDAIPLKWRRGVALRISSGVQVPTLAGILRPQIWMPPEWTAQFSDEELRCILLHELGHARRGDLAVQWLFAIAACIHWFNPLAWLVARAARLDRELACDAWVLSRDDADAAYGAALLKTVQLLCSPHRVPATVVAMASGRRSLRVRIAGIGGFRPSRTGPGIAGVAMMLAVLAIATSSRTTIGQTPEPVLAAPKVSLAPSTVAAAPSPIAAAPPPIPAVAGPILEVQAYFVALDGNAWKKMRSADADFRDETAAFANLDDFANNAPAVTGTVPDAAALSALKALGADQWQFLDGSYQHVGMLRGGAILWQKQFQKLLRYMEGRTGIDMICAPRVTTRSGNRAMIEAVREYRYPSEFEPDKRSASGLSPKTFTTQNIGVSLGAAPTFETSGSLAGTIELDLNPEVTNFLGFLPEKNGGRVTVRPMHSASGFWAPIFSISRGRTDLNLFPDSTVMLVGVELARRSDRLDFQEPPKRVTAPDSIERRVVVVFVTASIVAPEGIPVTDAKLPYATAVPGKPGFVTSPFAPEGYIDVRGLSKDEKVKDPYTGKIFLVP